MNDSGQPLAHVRIEQLDLRTSVEQALVAAMRFSEFALLESSRLDADWGRYSILARSPVKTLELPPDGVEPWETLKGLMAVTPAVPCEELPVPFSGGWIGYVTYEVGTLSERINPRTSDLDTLPGARFGLYDTAVVFDHRLGAWFAAAVDWPTGCGIDRPDANVRLRETCDFLRRAADVAVEAPPIPRTQTPTSDFSREDYLRGVERIKRYIEAGDVYQVNLTRRLTTRTSASPADLYRRLRVTSPSTHAALLVRSGEAVISSSPELFLDLRGRRVVTRPIKGTRPRGDEPWKDATLRGELAESEKDRAELNMIVDLLRNDLGKVSEYGTVRVVEPGIIEEQPTVFHRVATIESRLREGEDWARLLAATFPGGSITGAPKIRAMQIIRELEPTARGVYCGSIGWIGLHGDASFNIAIRTMVQRGDRVELHAGGGIVADSVPEDEYEESQVKLKGMLAALNVEVPIRQAVPIT